jgi:2-polyprenyl-3-methyl-5-hydroxy-6-metoxy-1,4-benzoquinol methylase
MGSLPTAYFDALYQDNPDPWNFASSTYEAEKYAATIAALPRRRYARALEVGCSIGVLSAALADHCSSLLGIDVAIAAIAQARTRNRGRSHVNFARRAFPEGLAGIVPAEGFDLIVLSEVLYYLDTASLKTAAQATWAIAAPDADVVMVHWLGPTPDYPLTGDKAADAFIAAMRPEARVLAQSRQPDYRIDVLRL